MPKSPLSSSFESADSKKGSKKGWLGLGAVAFFGLASAGSVFAASVTLNGGESISFTQGAETIAACDTAIGSNLETVYSASADTFSLTAIELTGIHDDCDGETLTLRLFDASNALLLTIEGTLATADDSDDGNYKISHASAIVEVAAGDPITGGANTWEGASGAQVVDFATGETAITMASDASDLVIEIN